MAVGAIEPQFYRELLARLGLDGEAELAGQWDRPRWPQQAARLAAVFAGRSRDDWAALFESSDACMTPVLRLSEVAAHPHHVARGVFSAGRGYTEPAAAPRM